MRLGCEVSISARRWSLIEVDEGGARIGPEFNAAMMFLACSKTLSWTECVRKIDELVEFFDRLFRDCPTIPSFNDISEDIDFIIQ